MYGWTAAEVTGKCTMDLLIRSSHMEMAVAKAAFQTSGEWSGEIRHVTKGGRDLVEARLDSGP